MKVELEGSFCLGFDFSPVSIFPYRRVNNIDYIGQNLELPKFKIFVLSEEKWKQIKSILHTEEIGLFKILLSQVILRII